MSGTPQTQAAALDQRRRGRRFALVLFALCAAPVVLGTFAYYFFPPSGRVNYGTLLPPRAFNPPAVLAGGAPVGPAVLADRWWLVTVDSSACDKACQYKLVLMRQMRLAQGKDADRIGRLWIVTDPGERADLAPALADGLVLARSAGPAAMAQWLGVADPSARIYLVDPLGNLMMSFPADPDTRRMLRDIERLLRINTWQKIQ